MLTYEDYKAMLERGENLPKVREGTCPLCGGQITRGQLTYTCRKSECHKTMRNWYKVLIWGKKRKIMYEAYTCIDYKKSMDGVLQRSWIIPYHDGYFYEPSPELGF